MPLPDLKQLRDSTARRANAVKHGIKIPDELSQRLKGAWDRCIDYDNTAFRIRSGSKGDQEVALNHRAIISAAIGSELTDQLHIYKSFYTKIFEEKKFNIEEQKKLFNAQTTSDNIGSEWAVIEQEIEKLNLITADKEKVKRFGLDNEWTGCSKGIGRSNDFYLSSVCHALGTNPTNQPMIAVASKDFISNNELRSIRDELVNFAEGNYNSEIHIEDNASVPDIKVLFTSVCDFCKSYNSSGEPWKRNDGKCDPAHNALKGIKQWLEVNFSSHAGIPLTISVSEGAGFFPKVPWVCILPEGQTAKAGVYVSICFGREGNGAVAGFAESVSNRKGLAVVKRSENIPLDINVNGDSPETKYNDSFQNPCDFRCEEFDIVKFKNHINASLDECFAFLGLKQNELFGAQHKALFRTSIERTCFQTGDSLSDRLIVALASKPLLILTGNSGTGKTKLAQLFANWLSGKGQLISEMIPVGADWTDNRNVLGFVNHLRTTQDGRPLYESTSILELIIRAAGDASRPYFLILDEMNLSHVERYFADFLSAIESGRPIPLHTSAAPLKSPRGTDVPAELILPNNLFITGTVNVDETTYMFSPKVLDRANVIEFRVTPGNAKAFLKIDAGGVNEIESAPEGSAEAFLALARKAREKTKPNLEFFKSEAEVNRAFITTSLSEIFGIMHTHRMEFGYRTMHDVLRYAGVDYELAANREKWSWAACLDVQILQKILPKLHGSKKRIEQLLVDLAVFCETGVAPVVVPPAREAVFAYRSKPTKTPDGAINPDTVKFRESYDKLAEMIEIVRRDQFVSFI